jgi:hypothetical protein
MEVGREALRRLIVWCVLAVCGVLQLAAQPPHPQPPLVDLLLPKHHGSPAPANTQSTPEVFFDATSLGSPLLLDKGWRVGITANPKAADTDFDDLTWAVRDAKDSFEEVPDQDHPAGSPNWDPHAPHPKDHQRPYAWFRLHIKLPPNHKPLVLIIELPPSENASTSQEMLSADVFANGLRIRPEGPHGDTPERYQQITRIYYLKLDPTETSLTLVLRTIFFPSGPGAYTGFFANRNVRLGYPEELNGTLENWRIHSLLQRIPRLVNSILLTVLALFLLALYITQKGHTEYLWLALCELLQAPMAFMELAGSTAILDQVWFQAIVLQLLAVSAYLYFEFLTAFLSLRRRWYIRLLRWTAPVMAGIAPLMIFAGHNALLGLFLAAVMLSSLFWAIGWFAFIFSTLISATLRRNFEASLLLLSLVLGLVAWIESLLTVRMSVFGNQAYHSPLTLHAGPIPINFEAIAGFATIFVIVLIIFTRFLRVQRDQERASSELAAARSVQELMIPQQMLVTPGFEVESIYNPANEVGGDFYHVHPTSDGGLLVVIGDVAGKGLKAAMNVSMLMGALRSNPERSPSKILASLNRVLVGSDSFTTCQAAWFGADGELVLANAGHLPPYLNSQEVMLPGGLPLGVLADISYEEVHLYLHPGDRILLMSDGVVEARQPSGELFGFDRVHNLSNQTAFYIADAAKDFGQEDDITVLTVRRLEL